MIRTIVVDDERPALNKLARLLENSGLTEIIGKYTKPLEALAFLQENKVDAVFLDIEMPGIDGIELASHILDLQEEIAVIFVTAYNQYAVEAFKLNALDYLMKPVTADRLAKALGRMTKNKTACLHGEAACLHGEAAPLQGEGTCEDIYVRCFGRFGVSTGTQAVKFRTEKAEELLAYIIDRRGRFISRSDILDSLWFDFDGDRALINFNTTLHYLKKALRQYGIRISFTFDRGGYQFDMAGIDCDYLNFCMFMENNKVPGQENIAEFEKTAALFTGEYLSGWEYDWVSIKRLLLVEQYIGLTLRLAEYYKGAGDFQRTDQWLKAGLLKEPLHRELNYRLMEALIASNEHALAAKYFDIYKSGLKNKLGQEPDEGIRRLFSE